MIFNGRRKWPCIVSSTGRCCGSAVNILSAAEVISNKFILYSTIEWSSSLVEELD